MISSSGIGTTIFAPPLADVTQLRDDLVPQVPRQNQDVVWALMIDSARVIHGDPRAHEEGVLLERILINSEFDQVLSDTAVV